MKNQQASEHSPTTVERPIAAMLHTPNRLVRTRMTREDWVGELNESFTVDAWRVSKVDST